MPAGFSRASALLLAVLLSPAAARGASVYSKDIAPADGTSGQTLTTGAGVKTGHLQNAAVTGAKIADGAVTDTKISGKISPSKITSAGLDADTVDGYHAASLAKKSANVIVVSRDGLGDFTDPAAALASITTASATNPFLVLIQPGVYPVAATVFGKPYVDIQGSGEDVTVLQGAPDLAPVLFLFENEEARQLTVVAQLSPGNTAALPALEVGGTSGSTLRFVSVRATGSIITAIRVGLPLTAEHVRVTSSGLGLEVNASMTLRDSSVSGSDQAVSFSSSAGAVSIVDSDLVNANGSDVVGGTNGGSVRFRNCTIGTAGTRSAIHIVGNPVQVVNSIVDGLTSGTRCANVVDSSLAPVLCN